MTEFKRYSKLHNVASGKVIAKIKELGMDQQPYEVREKIHGANFSITEFPDGRIVFGKRSSFLGDDANFNNFQRVAEDLKECIKKIRGFLSFSQSLTITVHGEIFGGGFYDEQAPQTKRVQGGVEYHPDIKFMGFDVSLDGVYMSAVDAYHTMKEAGFDQAPVIAVVDNLDEALAMPVDFTSMVPQFYGLECKPDNLAEGYVIKPTRGADQIGGSRLVLKYKTDKFQENKGAKTGKAQIKELSDADKEVFSTFSAFVNQRRLDCVLSKEEAVTQKDFGRVCGLLVQDALQDFLEGDFEVVLLKDIVEDPKQFKKEAQRIASDTLREVWIDLITEV